MQKQQMDRIFGGATVAGRARKTAKSGWFFKAREMNLWCRLCSRIFPNGTYRDLDGVECCPYADCKGVVARDASGWSGVRQQHPDYPVAPWPGVQYPLHPPAQKVTG
jgi:hypothetical protein